MPHDIFISYRRNGGEYTAKILRDRLTEAGYRVFFDVESLRSGDFNTKLYSVIDECTDFLLVLSPGALDRCVNNDDWVRREIEYAIEKGKNIVPVMLRGFSFPAELPPSIEPLRYRNGLEANSQFFDAFLQQLQEKFLLTRPTLRRRLAQNPLLRRTIPVLLALLILAGAGLGIRAVAENLDKTYPRKAAEKNLVEEVVYYAVSNLTAVDIISNAAYAFIDSGERYLSSSGDFERLRDEYEVRRSSMEKIDLAPCAASEGFLNRLADSPFDLADVKAMYQTTESTKTKWLDNLDFLMQRLDPNYPLSKEDKLTILACYRSVLDNELESSACACNHVLLPVTDEDALDDFFHIHLPELTVIPLSADRWVRDADALISRIIQCSNHIENTMLELSTRVGITNEENAALAKENEEAYETLVSRYMAQGYSREEAVEIIEKNLEENRLLSEVQVQYLITLGHTRSEAMDLIGNGDDSNKLMAALVHRWISIGHTREETVEIISTHVEDSVEMLTSIASIRTKLLPSAGDNAETLWHKLSYLLSLSLFEDARACTDAYGMAAPGSEAVTGAVHSFIDLVEPNGLLYGVMVMGYYEEDGINEVLRPGDIIMRVNGESCGSFETYMAMKEAVEGEYAVTVLRREDGTLSILDLTLSSDMPRLYLSTLVDNG